MGLSFAAGFRAQGIGVMAEISFMPLVHPIATTRTEIEYHGLPGKNKHDAVNKIFV